MDSQAGAQITSLRSLECFRAIMQTGSATAAARQLGLSQPAVSRLLGRLEQGLGFELFHRRKGRLLPTTEARALFREADLALKGLDRVGELARNIRDEDFSELTIVAPPSFAEGLLSRVISEFLAANPKLRISLDSQSVERAREMVALRAVDCGFVKLPAEHPGLECLPLVRAGTACALPARHRLAKRKLIRIGDLQGEPLILLGRGRASRVQVDEAFRAAGVAMNVKVETHTVGAACAFARDGVGIAIVNEMLARQYRDSALQLRRFEPDFVHEYAFMTSSSAPMARLTRRFYDHCKAYFSQRGRTGKLPAHGR